MPKLKELVVIDNLYVIFNKFLSVYYRLNDMKLRKSEEFELNELIK
jgi:hypothetical protein